MYEKQRRLPAAEAMQSWLINLAPLLLAREADFNHLLKRLRWATNSEIPTYRNLFTSAPRNATFIRSMYRSWRSSRPKIRDSCCFKALTLTTTTGLQKILSKHAVNHTPVSVASVIPVTLWHAKMNPSSRFMYCRVSVETTWTRTKSTPHEKYGSAPHE